MKKGDTLVVHAKREYDLDITNDVGGTTGLPAGKYRVRLDEKFYDYEVGTRCIGTLLDAKDVETSKKAGTTPYEPKKDFHPEKVYFGAWTVEK